MRGVILSDEDLQVAIDGKAVGHGVILFNEYIKRIQSTGTLIDRTSDRLMNKDFQAKGRRAKMFRPPTKSITTGRESSFAVTIKISYEPGEQMSVLVTPEMIIEEVIIGMELINNGKEEALRERIGNTEYFINFISLARSIAPDGNNINFVGFTSTKRAVALTRPNEEIVATTVTLPAIPQAVEARRIPIEIEGILDIAIGRGDERLGLLTDDGHTYEIIASEGMVDIVRQHFKQMVKVKGEYDRQFIYLESITDVEE